MTRELGLLCSHCLKTSALSELEICERQILDFSYPPVLTKMLAKNHMT